MKRVRHVRFDRRSFLPISAACVVANGIRETLSSLLGVPAAMRLCEPSIPPPNAWRAIAQGALLYRIYGTVADAALILRAGDAVALAASLFGEAACDTCDRALSPIEGDVLDRTVDALAGNLGAVCGSREGRGPERVADIAGFVTYFELLLEEPVAARIGVALSRDPAPEPRNRIEVAHLAGVRVSAVASLELGTIEAGAVRALAIGSIVPVDDARFDRCTLHVHGRRVAHGDCGVRNGHRALSVVATEPGVER